MKGQVASETVVLCWLAGAGVNGFINCGCEVNLPQ